MNMALVIGGLRLTWKLPVEGMGCGVYAAVGLPPLEGGTTISARFNTVEPRNVLEKIGCFVHVVGCGYRRVVE